MDKRRKKVYNPVDYIQAGCRLKEAFDMKKQIAALTLALALAATPALAATYPDVSAEAWYADATGYVSSMGLMSDWGDGNFHPNDAASRAMVVTVLYRAAGTPGISGGPAFADVPLTGWYYSGVAWAFNQGLVTGYDATHFGPSDPVTREQLAVILWRRAGSPAPQGVTSFRDSDNISPWALDGVTWAGEQGLMNGRDDKQFHPQEATTRAELAQILTRLSQG